MEENDVLPGGGRMKKIGLLLILVEIVALIIMGYCTADVPARPKIDPIQLQLDPADHPDEEIVKSGNFLQAFLFSNSEKSIDHELKIYFSLAREKSIQLFMNSQ